MQQFHNLDVITPIDVKIITKQHKSWALSYLMFMKEKRDGNIKGRGCAKGQKTAIVDAEKTDIIPHRIKPSVIPVMSYQR